MNAEVQTNAFTSEEQAFTQETIALDLCMQEELFSLWRNIWKGSSGTLHLD